MRFAALVSVHHQNLLCVLVGGVGLGRDEDHSTRSTSNSREWTNSAESQLPVVCSYWMSLVLVSWGFQTHLPNFYLIVKENDTHKNAAFWALLLIIYIHPPHFTHTIGESDYMVIILHFDAHVLRVFGLLAVAMEVSKLRGIWCHFSQAWSLTIIGWEWTSDGSKASVGVLSALRTRGT